MKERILAISHVLFTQKGFKAVRMDDIAADLGISKRTLYEIYPNKEDLIYETFKVTTEHNMESFGKTVLTCSDTMDILTEFIKLRIKEMRNASPCLIEEMKSYPRVQEYIETLKQQYRESSRKFYLKAQEEGYIRKDINTELLNDIYHCMNDSFFESKVYQKYKPEELFRTMLSLFIRSLCTQQGVVRFDKMLEETNLNND